MMNRIVLLVVLCLIASSGAVAAPEPFETPATRTEGNTIDSLVSVHLEKLGIDRAGPCSDAVFVRRVYLDVIGTIPTPTEARTFLESDEHDRCSVLIEELMNRDEFADYWSMKWCDLLRVKSEFPINLWPNAVQVYHRWIRDAMKNNMPYDRFARELLTSSGSNFRVGPVNFYRSMQGEDPESLATAVALAFMGVRLESLPRDQQLGMAAFFSQVGFKGTAEWKEEIVYHDEHKGLTNAPALRPTAAVFPDGTPAKLKRGADPRTAIAGWLIADGNPWFARNAVNRAWFWLLGRGIVHEPDDFRKDNPPSNPELLDYLAGELVKARYDMKHIYRLILNSQTYQSSSIPRSDHPAASAYFAFYPVRRLEAEVLIDAICGITGTTESYSSNIPEPFTFIPENQRSITLADGSITSPFLEMFGRPPRDTGLMSERNLAPNATQRLHLLNSSHIRNKYERSGKLRSLLQKSKEPRQVAETLYLAVLSRFPTQEELTAVMEYFKSADMKPKLAADDLVWALFNTKEFLYRH